MNTVVMRPAAPEQPKGAVERIFGVFFSPGETFQDIARRPSFVAPLVILILFALGTSIAITQRVGLETIVRQQIEANPRFADMPAEQRDRAIQAGITFGRVSIYLFPTLGVAASVLVIAGVLLLMANFVLGAEASFKSLFATTAHASLVGCVVAVLAIITVLLKDPADIDLQNIVTSNLGPLFDPASHKVLNRLASSIDLFSFWQIALQALGVSAAAKVSFKRGLIAVVIPWAVWVAGAVGLRAIF